VGASDRRTRGLLALSAIGLAIAGLVACNQILGTDKFSDGEETPGDAASPDGTVADGAVVDGSTQVDASFDSSFDATIQLPQGSLPETWAHWKMPDNVTDAAPAPSYANTADGGVLDNVTHLIWQPQTSPLAAGKQHFTDAQKVCVKPWRLPTRIELVSLLEHVDFEGDPDSGTVADPNFFNVPQENVWTGSPVLPAETTQRFWLVNFKDGTLARDVTARQVICVLGAP